MEIFRSIQDIGLPKCSAVTVGTYDGVHIGHRKVLEKLKEIAAQHYCRSVVVTFSPHPRIVLSNNKEYLQLIDTEEEKYEKFEKLGIDSLIIIPFDEAFSKLSYRDFVEGILMQKLSLKHFVFGKDHHLGHKREGTSDAIEQLSVKHGFKISYVNTFNIGGLEVSSTKIRNALLTGDILTANNLLGTRFSISSKVIEGLRIGGHIGFPTANLQIQCPYKIIPSEGVYAVEVKHNEKIYKGMMNIGRKPTVLDNGQIIPEVHIFDFSQDLYNEPLQVFFIEKIRNEIKFPDLEALKQQLQKDKKTVLGLLAKP